MPLQSVITYKLIRVNFYLPLKLRKKYTISVVVSRLSLSVYMLQAPSPSLCCDCCASCESPSRHPRATSDKRTLWSQWNYGLCHLSPQNKKGPSHGCAYMRNGRCYLSHNRGASRGAVGDPQRWCTWERSKTLAVTWSLCSLWWTFQSVGLLWASMSLARETMALAFEGLQHVIIWKSFHELISQLCLRVI